MLETKSKINSSKVLIQFESSDEKKVPKLNSQTQSYFRRKIFVYTCDVLYLFHNQFNNQASLTKWLNARLRTKWLWVRIPWLSLTLRISRPF